jgi:FeS assembly SUF system regulator
VLEMMRMSRLTDYGIVLMSYMAEHRERAINAAELAAVAQLPLPTVSKLLRLLAREELLVSQRGVKGGYTLAHAPEEISIAGIIRALEGPIALTVCTTVPSGECEYERQCPVRRPWQRINRAVRDALEQITLADMSSAAALGRYAINPFSRQSATRPARHPAA